MKDNINPIPLAIIGFATRYAQEATTADRFWEFILRGRQATTSFPKDRFNSDAFYHPDPEHGGTFHVEGAHFLSEDPLGFDAPFFNINKTEVLSLDPQQRLVMENVYHALENAGIPMEKAIRSKTSVYASGFNTDHMLVMDADLDIPMKHKPTGGQRSMIPNRVSWFYDFSGPSIAIDTACSSGLVAVHLAAQGLRSGDAEMAVVTGGSIIFHVPDTIAMSHSGFLGPQGKCFSFDHRAQGYGRGEGVGTVVIKTLTNALRDGDTIRAIIRNTGINQDGRTLGITLPSSTAQANLIREVYSKASLDPNFTRFVEAHGTGTAAGDPIEARGIADGFSSKTREVPLLIGALKSNIGHLEGGAGIAGLIKSVMVLESGIIPPNANFELPNPKILTKEWNIDFPKECIPWPENGLRRASINCFGFGGTNAHCIVDDAYHFLFENGLQGNHRTSSSVPTIMEIHEQTLRLEGKHKNDASLTKAVEEPIVNFQSLTRNAIPTVTLSNRSHIPRIFLFSSWDNNGLRRMEGAYKEYLSEKRGSTHQMKGSFLNDFAFTLSEKRSSLHWKSYVLADSISALEKRLVGISVSSMQFNTRIAPRIGFVFTGQGAQYHRMGQQLLIYPVFRESIEKATAFLNILGSTWSLTDEILKDRENSRINLPAFSHPACTSIQIALVELLASWNIYPSRVVGHSSGEIAAAFCAGKLSREAALKAAYFRGHVSEKQSGSRGAMLAVGLDEHALVPLMELVRGDSEGEITIACYNSPKNHTVSGDEEMIDSLKTLLDSKGLFSRKLNVQTAYHSAHMKPVAHEYVDLMGDLALGTLLEPVCDIEMFSTVTGKKIMEPRLDASYWAENMTSPVRFLNGLRSMLFQKDGTGLGSKPCLDAVIEIGPHSAMQSAFKEVVLASGCDMGVTYLSVLNRNDPTLGVLLNTIGNLACKNYPVNLHKVNHSIMDDEQAPQLLTDLPPYPFNHEEKGYYESRLSKNVRFREFPRHQLFGAPVQDWSRLNRRWRQYFRFGENPWLKDHVITGNCVFPGAGHLVMVLEALRQTAGDAFEITGIRFKDINFKTALVIPDTNVGVEVSLSILPVQESNQWVSTVWKLFQIISYVPSLNDWVEHCTGYVAIEYTASTPDLVGDHRKGVEATQAWQTETSQATGLCRVSLDARTLYDNLETIGMKYGPTFRNLSDICLSGEEKGLISADIAVPYLKEIMPKSCVHPHIIHPTTLDNTLVGCLAAICDSTGRTVLKGPLVPTYINEAWISTGINSKEGSKLRCYGEAFAAAYDSYSCNIKCWDPTDYQPRIKLSGVKFTPLTSNSDRAGSQISYGMDRKPAATILETPELLELVPVTAKTPRDKQLDAAIKLQLAAIFLITDGLADLSTNPPTQPLDGHLKIYFDWMERVVAELHSGTLQHVPLELWKKYSDDSILKQELYKSLEKDYNTNGEVLLRLGSNIAPIVRQEIDPLFQMFGQDDLLERHYEEVTLLNDGLETTKQYLSMMADVSAGLKILEVGAGTGSFTKLALKSLCPRNSGTKETTSDNKNAVAQYHFTDISPRFFSKAKQSLKLWEDLMTFQKLDIGCDPLAQGFLESKYDIIIANNVLHATPDLKKTLENCRLLLKPGGKILIQEGVRPDLHWVSVVFGTLPGWWLSVEPTRKWCPYITTSEWELSLQGAGFSGIDINIPSSHYLELSHVSTMAATALDKTHQNDVRNTKNLVMLCHVSKEVVGLIHCLKAQIALDVENITCVAMCDLEHLDLTDAICISLMELQQPLLFSICEDEFKNLQRLPSVCRKMLWITGNPKEEPAFQMSTGLLRTLRWEYSAERLDFSSLAVSDFGVMSSEKIASSIAKVFRYHFTSGQTGHANSEYYLQNNVIYMNRLVKDHAATDFLTRRFKEPEPEAVVWKDLTRPVKLKNSSPGLLNNLHWETDAAVSQLLGDSEVEIGIMAVGLNFVDLLATMGELPWDVVGREASGVVTRVGKSVHQLQPGDRVLYIPDKPMEHTFRTHGRTNQDLVAKIPDDMSFEIAASLPVIYATAIYSLENVARLAEGETILIHSAAGGVGQAAIQYSKIVGAEIFVTVSTVEKKGFLMKEYGIAEDHIFSSRDFNFEKGIMRMTGNTGVDVVLNSLSQEALRRSWKCVAPFGRFIEIGKKDLIANGKIDMSSFLHNVTFSGVDLLGISEKRPKIIPKLFGRMIQLWTEKKITGAHPITVLGYDQLETGMRMLQSGKQVGKIVFTAKGGDVIPVVPEDPPQYTFDPNASFVLSGGLGGIGRSLAQWMVSRGARSLIFLSRSGNITKAAQEMISYIESKGCRAKVFKCDVTDLERLLAVAEECRQALPQIKGCIQGSMVLRDAAFENLSYEDWTTVTRTKAQGSLNLYTAFAEDLDFFVMLSSVGGILGTRSQGNYAAGNTYQDAFAHALYSKGIRAASVDLGSVLSVGFIAENKDYTRHVSRAISSMREDEVHAIVEYLINPRNPLSESTCQVIFGIETMKSFQKRGIPPPDWLEYPTFGMLRNIATSGEIGTGDIRIYNSQALLTAAKNQEEAIEIVTNSIISQLSVLLNMPVDQIDANKSIRDSGVDSLIAMEFRTWLAKELGAELPLIEIMAEPGIVGLSCRVAALSKFVKGSFQGVKSETRRACVA